METEKTLRDRVRPIIENLVFDIACDKPQDVPKYMINWLQKYGGYTSNGLTVTEKVELEKLRSEINRFRQMETDEKDNISDKSEDEDDTIDDDKVQNSINKAKVRMSNPRVGVSSEVYGVFNKKEDWIPKYIQKTEEQIHRIKLKILQSFLFSNLDKEDINYVIGAMEEKIFNQGENVIVQGENGDCLYVVESGELDCFKKFSKDEEPKLVKTYTAGDSFGELALLYNSPRAATVVAKTSCITWLLDRETFNRIVKDAAQRKREKYEDFLKSIEILSTVEPYELTQIADALKTSTYKRGDYVIREGEVGDVFYIIEEGNAIATKTFESNNGAQIVKEYKKGDYFGELALIKGEPRAANIVAEGSLKLISLDRNSFRRLLGPIEEILKRNSDKYIKFIK